MDEPRPVLADAAAAVTDPIFGRDIGFFLFELPFLRFVQATVQRPRRGVADRWPAPATSSGRSRGSLVFSTPVRVHLGVLGGLFLLSVAFGYQLDKYELVYSNRGIAHRRRATRTRTPSSSPTTC